MRKLPKDNMGVKPPMFSQSLQPGMELGYSWSGKPLLNSAIASLHCCFMCPSAMSSQQTPNFRSVKTLTIKKLSLHKINFLILTIKKLSLH